MVFPNVYRLMQCTTTNSTDSSGEFVYWCLPLGIGFSSSYTAGPTGIGAFCFFLQVDGTVLLEDDEIPGGLKYEGLSFLMTGHHADEVSTIGTAWPTFAAACVQLSCRVPKCG